MVMEPSSRGSLRLRRAGNWFLNGGDVNGDAVNLDYNGSVLLSITGLGKYRKPHSGHVVPGQFLSSTASPQCHTEQYE